MTLKDDINARLDAMVATQQEQAADMQAAIDEIHSLKDQLAAAASGEGLSAADSQAVLDRLTALGQAMADTAAKFPEPPPAQG